MKSRFFPQTLFLLALFFSVNGFAHAGSSHDPSKGKTDFKPSDASDFYDMGAPDPVRVELGRFLFFDKILSGNRNISCATCHHPLTDTGDGLSLSVGEGGRGLGMTRDTGVDLAAIKERVTRNAPHLFNLGAREFTKIFHDGRVEVDKGFPSGIKTPAGHDLPDILDNVLAAQAMFPVTSAVEMCGQVGENPLAELCSDGDLLMIWEHLSQRLRQNEEYVTLFQAAFPDIYVAADITFAHVANAIAAYEASAWRADNSPFDRYIRGDRKAMSRAAKRGMKLFYGKAKCFTCHRGVFQTDHQFYAVAMPQIGPGKGHGSDGLEDHGRSDVSGNPDDRFRFRTPTLRNVALTGPWGHDGAFNNLQAVVRHFLNPVESLYNYDVRQAVLPSRDDLDDIDFAVMSDPARVAEIAAANEIKPVDLGDDDVDNLIDFLRALTDPASIDLRHDVPGRVPSGLPIAD